MPSRENKSHHKPLRPNRSAPPPSSPKEVGEAVPIRIELPDDALIAPPSIPAPRSPERWEPPAQVPTLAQLGQFLKPEDEKEAPSEFFGPPAPEELPQSRKVDSNAPKTGSKLHVWLWTLLGLLAGIPLVLTLIGALTSPPHIKGIPNGHLVYLDAEAPSEKTTTLRGLYVTSPGRAPRLLVHENEPQDIDGGVREWITQPALSPDGTQLAFEKQLITLQEEKQTIQNQIWVMPLLPSSIPEGGSKLPHLVIDLTQQKLKQIVGLTWDSDSSVLFLQDKVEFSVPTDTPDEPLKIPLNLHGLTLAKTPDISATRNPMLSESGSFTYGVQTPTGPQVLIQNKGFVRPGPASAIFALAPAGDRIAFVPPGTKGIIRTFDIAANAYGPDIKVRWGWSVFGKRRITSLRWSPDGSRIAFTVSKPPVPEDEIFIVTVASGKTVQLPYRSGRAAWDWAR